MYLARNAPRDSPKPASTIGSARSKHEPIKKNGVDPGRHLSRLARVQQNYIRAETLSRANACLVDAQARIPLAQAFGGDEVASGFHGIVIPGTLHDSPYVLDGLMENQIRFGSNDSGAPSR